MPKVPRDVAKYGRIFLEGVAQGFNWVISTGFLVRFGRQRVAGRPASTGPTGRAVDTQPFEICIPIWCLIILGPAMAGTVVFAQFQTHSKFISSWSVGYPDIPTRYYILYIYLYTNKMVGYIVCLHDVLMLSPLYPDDIHDFRPRRLWTCRRCCRGCHSSCFGGAKLCAFWAFLGEGGKLPYLTGYVLMGSIWGYFRDIWG